MAEDLIISGIRIETEGLTRGSRQIDTELQRVEQAVNRTAQRSAEASGSLAAMAREERRVFQETLRVTGSMDKAARAVDRMRHGTADAAEASERATRSFRAQNDAIDRLTKRAVAFIAAYVGFRQLKQAARFVFDTNVEFQKLEAQLKTVTGSAARANTAFDMITNFAATTPFEVQDLTESFVRLRAFGVIPTEERLRGMGNISAAFSRNITELTDAVISGANGMTRPLRSFGIDVQVSGNKAVVTFQDVRREIPLTTEALSAFVAEMGSTGRMSTAMSDQMQTLGGAISNVKDRASLFAKEIGDQGLNAELVRTIRRIDELIGSSDDLAISLGQGAAGAVRGLTALLEAGAPILKFWADQLAKIGDQSLNDAAPTIKGFESFDDPVAVNARLGIAAENRDIHQRRVEQLQAQLAQTPEKVRRAVGGQVEETVNPAFQALERDIAKAEERVRVFDHQIDALLKKKRELLSPDTAVALPDGGFEDIAKSAKAAKDPIDQVLERLAAGEREIATLEAALRGTAVEFDANAERAQLYEGVVRDLARIEDERAKAILPDAIRKMVEYREAVDAAEEAEKRLARAKEVANRAFQRSVVRHIEREEEKEKKAFEALEAEVEAQREVANQFASHFEDAFVSIISGTDSVAAAFHRMAQSIIADLARIAIQRAIIGPIIDALFPLPTKGGAGITIPAAPIDIPYAPAPGKAKGGFIGARQAHIVGELGPELFVPSSAGVIIPHDRLKGAVGGVRERVAQEGARAEEIRRQNPVDVFVERAKEAERISDRSVPPSPPPRSAVERLVRQVPDLATAPVRPLRPESPVFDARAFDRILDSLPHFAEGGFISAGEAAVVGERGPELFMPSRAGTIHPSAPAKSEGGGGKLELQMHNTFELKNIDSRDGIGFVRQHIPLIAREVAHELQKSGGLRRLMGGSR